MIINVNKSLFYSDNIDISGLSQLSLYGNDIELVSNTNGLVKFI